MGVGLPEHLWKKSKGFGQEDAALQRIARFELASSFAAEMVEGQGIDGVVIVYAELAVAACPGGHAGDEAADVNWNDGEESLWLEEYIRRRQSSKKSRAWRFHFDCPVRLPRMELIFIACSKMMRNYPPLQLSGGAV